MAAPRLKPFSGGASSDILGFDLNEEHFKFVHVRMTALGRQVTNLVSQDVRGMSEDDVSGALAKAAAGLKLKNPKCFLMVPMHTVITRTIEVPSRDPAEIREIVNLQASRHTPYSRTEIITDVLFLGAAKENYTKVLLVIAPREAIVRETLLLGKAGLKVEKVFFPPEGIASACAKILGKETGDSATAVVHMDAVFTNFLVIQAGKVLFVRGITIGARQLLEEKETYGDRFVDELQKSVEAYGGDEAGPPPAVLLLTGVAAETHHLDDLFSETLHIPIKHQAYFDHFSISKEALSVAASSKQLSFFNVIAPLLLFDKMKVDLVTEERKLKMQLERRGKEALTSGILVMVLLALVFAMFTGKVYFKSAYLEKLTTRYDPIVQDAKNLEELFAKTQGIKNYLAKRGNSIETFVALYDALPKDVRLGAIRYDDGTKFSVKGTSASMASVFTFVTNLEKSEKFTSVKTKYVTSRNEEGLEAADFEIVSEIAGPRNP